MASGRSPRASLRLRARRPTASCAPHPRYPPAARVLLLLDYSRDAGLGASPRPARAARAAWVLGSPRGVSLALRPVASSPSPPSPPPPSPPPSPPPPPPDGGDARSPALASPSVNALGRSPSPSARSPLAPLSLVAERARARTALALTARTCSRHSRRAASCYGTLLGGVEQRSGDQGGCGGAEAWRPSSGCSGGPLTHRRRLRRCCTGHEWLSRSLHGVLKKVLMLVSHLRQICSETNVMRGHSCVIHVARFLTV